MTQSTKLVNFCHSVNHIKSTSFVVCVISLFDWWKKNKPKAALAKRFTLRPWWGLVCWESSIGLKWEWRVKKNTQAGRWNTKSILSKPDTNWFIALSCIHRYSTKMKVDGSYFLGTDSFTDISIQRIYRYLSLSLTHSLTLSLTHLLTISLSLSLPACLEHDGIHFATGMLGMHA